MGDAQGPRCPPASDPKSIPLGTPRRQGLGSASSTKIKVAEPSSKDKLYLKIPLIRMIYLQGVPASSSCRSGSGPNPPDSSPAF